ncbi:MAG: hypothetical protein L6Q35_00460 [Phycisphaerales bacterium]|nr:hypothetical protein [Phycisphaerales bacterium]
MAKKYVTVLTSGFTHQNGDDPRASGGVTYTELAVSGEPGVWLRRRTDANGMHTSSGRAERVDRATAEQLLQAAESRADDDARNNRSTGPDHDEIAQMRRTLGL